MQASRLTLIAEWLASWPWAWGSAAERSATWCTVGASRSARAGSRSRTAPASMASRSAMDQRWLERSGLASRAGWSASSSSMTPSRASRARAESALLTTMPGAASRMQLAASTRSPSTSTMQARQLPSAR